MKIVLSKNHVPIRITDERLLPIIQNHPEMEGQEDKIVETLKTPDMILNGDFGELLAVKFYANTPVSKKKYLIVEYKEITDVDGFILTAYFSRKLSKRRKVIWKP
ncbi:hypothetical protein ACX8XP_12430 [Calditrichota bacterium LG25]